MAPTDTKTSHERDTKQEKEFFFFHFIVNNEPTEASQRRTILNIFMKQINVWELLGFSKPSLTSNDMT